MSPRHSIRRARAGWMAAAILVAAVAGCGDGGTAPKASGSAGVTITPKELTLPVGGTGTLGATVRDDHGNEVRGAQIFWSSADTALAVVSPEGVVRAKKAGTVKIAASVGGVSDVATVTISPQAVTSISLSPVTATLTVGGSLQLAVTLSGANGETLTGRTVTWHSSNESVLSVDANGRVTATAPGAASVTATSEGRTTSAAITVVAVAVGSVAVTPTAVSLTVGQTTQLSAVVTDVNGQVVNDRDVRWTSNNEGVATVSSTGLAIGLAPGSATITATADGKSASVSVTVSPLPVQAIVVSPSPAQLTVGQSVTLGVQITDASGKIVDRAKTFSSDAPSIATVDAQGVVRGVAPGTTTIRVSSEGRVGTTTVIVSRVPVASVSVSPSTASVVAGRTVTLSATVRDASGATLTDRTVTWSSSNTAVATVSQSGVVTGLAPGSAVIFATSEGQSDQAAVTVTPVPVGSVTVAPTSSTVTVGATTQLSATVRDADGATVTDRVVTWTTSDPLIALVSGTGLVTGVNPGSATITATSEGRSGTSSVTVAPVPVASVTVAPASSTVAIGGSAQLSATLRDASGNTLIGRTVSWTSSAPAVASVDQNGLVRGLAAGSVTITATSEGQSGTASVSVTGPVVASVVITPATAKIKVGGDVTLTASCRDASNAAITGVPITWTMTTPGSIATYTVTGDATIKVAAKKKGTASFTATCGGKSATATVEIE